MAALPIPNPPIEVPRPIADKRDAWKKLWEESAQIHYLFGVLSVAASAIAAAVGGDWARGFSAGAAILTAIIGFTQPEQRYKKFVKPWRVLDVAIKKYELGQISIEELLAALEKGEALITETESK